MSEKVYENVFRFTLYQGNSVICEKIFTADLFNPVSRYSVDIRDIIPSIVTKLQKVLSKKSYDTVYYVGKLGNGGKLAYDLYGYKKNIINALNEKYPNTDFEEIPESVKQFIGEKVIKGVECKFGLYINDKPIVERLFYVDGFNVIAKNSLDVLGTINFISDQIFEYLKKNDVKHMWDDYDLINRYSMSIHQIRELPKNKREDLLRKLV
jgi:hypothetical protein